MCVCVCVCVEFVRFEHFHIRKLPISGPWVAPKAAIRGYPSAYPRLFSNGPNQGEALNILIPKPETTDGPENRGGKLSDIL